MVDACAAAGIKPFYGPFGDFRTPPGASTISKYLSDGLSWRMVAPPFANRDRKEGVLARSGEVAFAKKIVTAMPDGAGAVMIDGKMQDDATWKQAKVLLDLAKLVAAKDPAMATRYAL